MESLISIRFIPLLSLLVQAFFSLFCSTSLPRFVRMVLTLGQFRLCTICVLFFRSVLHFMTYRFFFLLQLLFVCSICSPMSWKHDRNSFPHTCSVQFFVLSWFEFHFSSLCSAVFRYLFPSLLWFVRVYELNFINSSRFRTSETQLSPCELRSTLEWSTEQPKKKILVEVNKQINHSERERERGRSAARILLSESVRFQSIVNIAHPHTIDENNYTFIQICCFFWSVVIAAFRILSFDLIENKSQRTKRFLWNSNTRTHERIWNTGQGAKETESKTEGANEKFALSELLRQNVNKRKSISII